MITSESDYVSYPSFT